MQTIDLDELWHAMPQTTGVTASGMMAAARALHTDRLYRQGHHDADALNSGVEQSAPSTAHNDLSAIEMPDLEIRPAAPTFDLRNRLPKLDGFLKSFDTSSAVWLSMGFISGMIAWHSVGFWGFVTEAVLQPGDRDYKIAVATTTPALEQPLAGSARVPLTTGALADKPLQFAMTETGPRFIYKRTKARDALPEFDQLRDQSRDIKNHVLEHLDIYLERYEAKVQAAGGHVHWAGDADEARAQILGICQRVNAKIVTKGKSMISEEIELNHHLEANGITPVETDLGEYLIQLRNERPSHIIAPVVHLTRDQVEADFRKAHTHLDPRRDLTEIPSLVEEARAVEGVK